MKKFIIFFCLCLLGGCKDQKIFIIPFTNSQIVLNAVLKANEIPEVYVGKTWAATGTFPEITYLDNATVKLFEEEVYIGTFTHTAKGIYKLASYKLKAGKKYVLRAEVAGLNPAENTPVKIPNALPLQNLFIDKTTTVSSLNQSAKPVLLKVALRNDVTLEAQYGIVVETYKTNYPVSSVISPLETSISLSSGVNENCIKRSALFGNFDFQPLIYKSSLFIYNTDCFINSSKEMNIVVETIGYIQKTNDYSQQPADEIRVQLFGLSDEYYEYTSRNKFFEGLDYAFNEPTPTYTNVKGGYGVVVALNRAYRVVRL